MPQKTNTMLSQVRLSVPTTPPVTDSKNVNKLYTELCFEHTRNYLPTSFGKGQANYTIKNKAN